MDLATATPAQVDTALAEIWSRYHAVMDKIAQNAKHAADLEKGLAKKAENIAAGGSGGRYSGWKQESLDRLLAEQDALYAQAHEIIAEAEPFDFEFTRRGRWSRFFLVTNNGGHIHSSMSCSTCFPTTRFGWLPEFSGQTEAEAVAKHGAILCTVCYPSAPTEWTNGVKPGDENVCAGSGEYLHSDLPHRSGYAYGNWATCSVCGSKPALTKGYRLRKHNTGQVFK